MQVLISPHPPGSIVGGKIQPPIEDSYLELFPQNSKGAFGCWAERKISKYALYNPFLDYHSILLVAPVSSALSSPKSILYPTARVS